MVARVFGFAANRFRVGSSTCSRACGCQRTLLIFHGTSGSARRHRTGSPARHRLMETGRNRAACAASLRTTGPTPSNAAYAASPETETVLARLQHLSIRHSLRRTKRQAIIHVTSFPNQAAHGVGLRGNLLPLRQRSTFVGFRNGLKLIQRSIRIVRSAKPPPFHRQTVCAGRCKQQRLLVTHQELAELGRLNGSKEGRDTEEVERLPSNLRHDASSMNVAGIVTVDGTGSRCAERACAR